MKNNWKMAFEKEFTNCLKKFPELKDEKLKLLIEVVKEDNRWQACTFRLGGKRIVALFVPESLKHSAHLFRPFIFHELCHAVDLHDPGKLFSERADEPSKKFYKKLEDAGFLKCQVVGDMNVGGVGDIAKKVRERT